VKNVADRDGMEDRLTTVHEEKANDHMTSALCPMRTSSSPAP